MKHLRKSTAVEKIAGSIATESTLTVVAALAGGPLAPLLPVLAKSLAARRQQERVEAALVDIQEILVKHEHLLETLTDEQYKIVNEIVLATLHTTQEEKLTLLRHAVRNALTLDGLSQRSAAMLSRIVRDISAEEARFLLGNFQYDGIQLIEAAPDQPVNGNILRVGPKADDATLVTGLYSLGVLTPGDASWGGSGVLGFGEVAGKLLALLRNTDA